MGFGGPDVALPPHMFSDIAIICSIPRYMSTAFWIKCGGLFNVSSSSSSNTNNDNNDKEMMNANSDSMQGMETNESNKQDFCVGVSFHMVKT